MAKKGNTYVSFLLDESGSMGGREGAVIEGYNQFLTTLQQEEGKIKTTLAMFDSGGDNFIRYHFKNKRIAEVEPLRAGDYSPRGATPLNDSILDIIRRTDKEVGKDDKAMIIVLTDGLENASEANSESVRRAIEKKEKKDWVFIYLGAHQEAWSESSRIGLGKLGSSFATAPGAMKTSISSAASVAGVFHAAPSAAAYHSAMGEAAEELGTDISSEGFEKHAERAKNLIRK